MIQISILGCGWLGFPLAKSLLQKSYLVNGSTTSVNKLAVLKAAKIHPFLIQVNEQSIDGDLALFLHNSKVLIIDIPPKLRGKSSENFVSKIKNTVSFIEQAKIKNVLFISSTSVFADDNSVVTERSAAVPDTESGKQLLEVENILRANANFETTIVRFGGLIGPDRHPIKMLSGKTNVPNPNAFVNLIHQNDCIAIIEKIIAKSAFGKTYNAVAPIRLSRQVYYTQKAIEFKVTPPLFDTSKPSVGKQVLSDYLCADLDFCFQNI